MRKVAVVHEWLASCDGSEKVVQQILDIYPHAHLYSLVDFLPAHQRAFIQDKSVTTSFIQQLPFAKRSFRSYLPLMPLAIEQFDLSGYDLIISSHHAVAKGVITRPDQLHICYIHTPLRYGWEFQHQYLHHARLEKGTKSWFVRAGLHYLRLWDVMSANRVDRYVANSRYVARRVEKTYRRSADVIYPPVNTQRFVADAKRDNFYLTVSRFVPYKRLDLIVDVFNHLGLPLVVIGDGNSRSVLEQMAKPNIRFLGRQPDAVVEDYMQRCQGFIFASEEDFGITPVEAQAAGAPVIAYAKGGQAETIVHGKTGLLFLEQTVESLAASVRELHSGETHFDPKVLRVHAEQFSASCFRARFETFVEQTWIQFQTNSIAGT